MKKSPQADHNRLGSVVPESSRPGGARPVDDLAGDLPGGSLGVRAAALLPLIHEQLPPPFGKGACQGNAAPQGFLFPNIGQITAIIYVTQQGGVI